MLHLSLLFLIIAPSPIKGMLVAPYVQLGETGQMTVMWHAAAGSRGWSVRVGERSFEPKTVRRVSAAIVGSHDVLQAPLDGLSAGSRIQFELLKNGRIAYGGSAVVPKAASQPFSFVALGDIGRGTSGQKKIAYQIHSKKPDYIVMLGDIVYPHGRMSEYRKFLFPIWESSRTSPSHGAPLLSTTLTVPVPGNHDTAYRNLGTYPDGLAYYSYWSTPRNGPALPPTIKGPLGAISALDAAAGGLSRIGNYSFGYGNARWVVLDSNHYVNWKTPALRAWLDKELSEARKSTWSFVAFHGPPYSSSKKHASDTVTRTIAELIHKHRVDVVFNGHIHNYQRTKPLSGSSQNPTIDRTFDGKVDRSPQGTIYVISGAGGAELYDQGQPAQPATWKPFTATFKAGYSFTHVTVQDRQLTLRQISADGAEMDRIVIEK